MHFAPNGETLVAPVKDDSKPMETSTATRKPSSKDTVDFTKSTSGASNKGETPQNQGPFNRKLRGSHLVNIF